MINIDMWYGDKHTEAEALEAFVLLENGCICFMDYIDNFTGNVISRENFIKAIGQ